MVLTEVTGGIDQARQAVEVLKLPVDEGALPSLVEAFKPFIGGTMCTEERDGKTCLVLTVQENLLSFVARSSRTGNQVHLGCVDSHIEGRSIGDEKNRKDSTSKVFKLSSAATMFS